ncbi:hypothetical protein [Gemmatimonas sp.]|uniref:hypothetical protein n=1 Tax=Gemmatimonas sp. TaxID=1962908 RepID=UPI003569D2CC
MTARRTKTAPVSSHTVVRLTPEQLKTPHSPYATGGWLTPEQLEYIGRPMSAEVVRRYLAIPEDER